MELKQKQCVSYSTTSLSRTLLVGLFFLAIVSATLTVHMAEGFEYSGYCQKMCMWGRGGNLCKCSAVHFAGKRGGEGIVDRAVGLEDMADEGFGEGDDLDTEVNPAVDDGDWRNVLIRGMAELQKRDPSFPEVLRYYLKTRGNRRMERSLEGAINKRP